MASVKERKQEMQPQKSAEVLPRKAWYQVYTETELI